MVPAPVRDALYGDAGGDRAPGAWPGRRAEGAGRHQRLPDQWPRFLRADAGPDPDRGAGGECAGVAAPAREHRPDARLAGAQRPRAAGGGRDPVPVLRPADHRDDQELPGSALRLHLLRQRQQGPQPDGGAEVRRRVLGLRPGRHGPWRGHLGRAAGRAAAPQPARSAGRIQARRTCPRHRVRRGDPGAAVLRQGRRRHAGPDLYRAVLLRGAGAGRRPGGAVRLACRRVEGQGGGRGRAGAAGAG